MHASGWLLIGLPALAGVYAYVVYPAILWLIPRARSANTVALPPEWPLVSIVIPAYNEEAQISGAIEALLAQDYPADRRQILILSDASTDRTDDIVRSYADRGVELLRMDVRGGKTKAENASCALLLGEIVVNSDASIRLLPDAVRHLVTAMLNPTVGVASGRDVSVATVAAVNATEAGYVGYEMWVRALETRCGGIVGASGSGYAIRKALHEIPIRDDLSRDFSAALTARAHGYSAVSVDGALCQVPRTSSLRREYRRKVRTISRGMATLRSQRNLLNVAHHGLFSWKLISHKLCRWLVPLSVVPSLAAIVILAPFHVWARTILVAAVMIALLAGMGFLWPAHRPLPRILSIPAFGVAANIAVIHAWWRSRSEQHEAVWEPTRR